MNRNTVLLLAVFAVGCAAGMHLDSKAQAQAFPTPAKVQKWQQRCMERPGTRFGSDMYVDINKRLMEEGSQGWELTSADNQTLCFKRPIE